MYKKIKQKTFWVGFWSMAAVGLVAAVGLYIASEQIHPLIINGKADQLVQMFSRWLDLFGEGNFYYWALPVVIVLFIFLGVLLWAIFTSSIKRLVKEMVDTGGDERKGPPAKKDFIDQKIERERRQRLFLHNLSILQREGRLLDFFDEDLSRYEDAQIGAAVRSIQEDCKKAVKKYIDPRPVLEGNEGDTITLEAGFDIDAITLVGNVAGKPPFKGVIKHPGWKAGKKEVPKLSDVQDASIMTPAEVEIQ